VNAGLIPLAIATIGASYAALVLRGWRRRDNLMFGLLVLTDAAMTAWRGINVLTGGSMIARGVLVPCMLGTIVLAMLTLEFISAFPRRPAMSWRWRAAMLAWGGIAVVTVAATADHDPPHLVAELVFFMPAMLVVFALGARAFASTRQRDARIVIAMLWFRWGFGALAYFIGPLAGVFEQAVWAETTVATMISFVVIGTAVLRSELFSIRCSSAEVVTIATLALLVMLGGGVAVTAALTFVEPGRMQQLALFGAALVPLALAALGYALYPRVERRVLARLDERRARRLGIQDDPLPADAGTAITEAGRRIAAIGDGATVRWVATPDLPPALAHQLAVGDPLRRDLMPELPASFIVPARGAERGRVGAVYHHRGLVDRDPNNVARSLGRRDPRVRQAGQAERGADRRRRADRDHAQEPEPCAVGARRRGPRRAGRCTHRPRRSPAAAPGADQPGRQRRQRVAARRRGHAARERRRSPRRDRDRGPRPRHPPRRPAADLRAVLHDPRRWHRPGPRDRSQGDPRPRRRHQGPLHAGRRLDIHDHAAAARVTLAACDR
jgi:hypothetical protein